MAQQLPKKSDLDTVARRATSIANHLMVPLSPASSEGNGSTSVGLCNTSMDDSYHKIHGQVSQKEVVWRSVSDESGKEFTDIIYEKAVGEDIAKVRVILSCMLWIS
uniref:1 4-dihydroxy-2-naphthoyl-CoA synthase peroxisomal-like n=1 Tax=Rhizophora mucronata TaxID=61149 RepID=A0A2P2MFA7_RHIMU